MNPQLEFTPTYTEQQLRAIDEQEIQLGELMKYYDKGTKVFKLSGLAGCGKTHLTVQFVKAIRDRMIAETGMSPVIGGAALSHGAKNVLANRFVGEGLKVKFYTIASLLKLSRMITDAGEIRFVPSYKKKKDPGPMDRPPIYSIDLLIVDECSQISQDALNMINEEKGEDTIILFLGDHHQTPPPSEDRKPDTDSPTFKYPGANLSIPFRYEGDIQKLAMSIANEIDKINEVRGFKFLVPFTKSKDVDYTFTRNATKFYDKFVDSYNSDEDKIHGSILVNYRNRVTAELSRTIRKKILYAQGVSDSDIKKYLPGERLVCKRGAREIEGTDVDELTTHKVLTILRVKSHYASIKTPKKKPNVFKHIEIGDTFTESFDPAHNFEHIPVFLLDLVDEMGTEFNNIPVLKDDMDLTYLTWRNRLKRDAETQMKASVWAKYYAFIEFFTEFEFGYAVNTYVVQGASYNHIFVNLRDILSVGPLTVREKLQSLYTATTRARKSVTILV